MNRRVFLSLLATLPFVGRWFRSPEIVLPNGVRCSICHTHQPFDVLEFPDDGWPQGSGIIDYDYWSPLLLQRCEASMLRTFGEGFQYQPNPIEEACRAIEKNTGGDPAEGRT